VPERPAHCYRYFDTPPYTRKEYIHGIPGPKIVKFNVGNVKGVFDLELQLVPTEDGQIRHNALEAARVAAAKVLSRKIGEANYHLKVIIYPHHVLRENKMMAFAGADRLQDGMRKAFGSPAGTAARVKAMRPIMSVRVRSEHLELAKRALEVAASKMPMPCKILVKQEVKATQV